jgi:thiol-disulfide isomerase/thioredoxin
MEIKLLLLMIFSSLAASVDAFMARPTFGSVPIVSRTILSAFIEIGSEAAFDKKIKSSGSALVIVDYSTTWCGPCKGAFAQALDGAVQNTVDLPLLLILFLTFLFF